MFDYPKWKYWIIAVVIALSTLYSLPNLFQPVASVQVTPVQKGQAIEASVKGTVEAVLIGKAGEKIPAEVVFENDRVVATFTNDELQLKAADRLKQDPLLKDKYDAALNQTSTVPAWLRAINGKAMTLGLDLRGGVQFLLEVDEKTTRDLLDRRIVDTMYDLFRRQQIAYTSVSRENGQLVATFVTPADALKARAEIGKSVPEVTIADGGGATLAMAITPQVVSAALSQAVEQNTTTLRDRLGAIAEPVVQRQGQSRILVQLPGMQNPDEAKRRIGATASLEYRAVDYANNERVMEIKAAKVARFC
jgi:preprotein translocase subunit SecD